MNDMTAHNTPVTPAPAIKPDAAVSLNRSHSCGRRISHTLATIAPLKITQVCSGKIMKARPMLVPLGTNLETVERCMFQLIYTKVLLGIARTRSSVPGACYGGE